MKPEERASIARLDRELAFKRLLASAIDAGTLTPRQAAALLASFRAEGSAWS